MIRSINERFLHVCVVEVPSPIPWWATWYAVGSQLSMWLQWHPFDNHHIIYLYYHMLCLNLNLNTCSWACGICGILWRSCGMKSFDFVVFGVQLSLLWWLDTEVPQSSPSQTSHGGSESSRSQGCLHKHALTCEEKSTDVPQRPIDF